MQRHVKHKFENAFGWGIVALLVVCFALVSGNGINTMAIYEDNAQSLSPQTGTGIGFMIAVTIASILFVVYAFDFAIVGHKLKEEEENKIRVFAAQCRGRGYSKERIITLLAEHGWDAKEIKTYLS